MNTTVRPIQRTADPRGIAQKVLHEYWDGALPVVPAVIARSMGVIVHGRGGRGEPDYKYSGYFRLYGSQPVIEINNSDSPVRQRFTCAHELGHYVLGHENLPRDYPSSFGSGVTDPRERAANRFAAELLMPEEAVQALVLSGRMSSVEELAKAFQVSAVAMAYRLSDLKLRT